MEYTITALEYGENPEIASVCAVDGQVVYEDPEHTGIPIKEARAVAEELDNSGVLGDVIEETWFLLS